MNDDYGDVTQVLDYDDFFDDIDGSEAVPSKSCFDCDKVLIGNYYKKIACAYKMKIIFACLIKRSNFLVQSQGFCDERTSGDASTKDARGSITSCLRLL